MKKILITGSSGFIGKNLINYLNRELYNIIPFSRANGFDYNVLDYNYLNKESITSIVHLAGKAHDLKSVLNEQDYFNTNTNLTIKIFDAFLNSNAKSFIFFSSVKAVKDHLDYTLTEDTKPSPISAYGKSKLSAENYILSKLKSTDKQVFIFRPCLINGPGNKGNLTLLYKLVSKNFPWPLGAFCNKRSFCSIDNLCFIVGEFLERYDFSSGIYNIADDEPISTNDIIKLIGESINKKSLIVPINKYVIRILAKFGDVFKLPLNSDRLTKLTESYIVSNAKIKIAIGKELPISTRAGLIKTFQSFIK